MEEVESSNLSRSPSREEAVAVERGAEAAHPVCSVEIADPLVGIQAGQDVFQAGAGFGGGDGKLQPGGNGDHFHAIFFMRSRMSTSRLFLSRSLYHSQTVMEFSPTEIVRSARLSSGTAARSGTRWSQAS